MWNEGNAGKINPSDYRYVVDPTNYTGGIITSMPDGVHCYYYGRTIEELRIEENNPNLQVVTNRELYELDVAFKKSLQGPFEEITEEEYYYHIGCVPPIFRKGFGFFVSEPFYQPIHRFCFCTKTKFYSGLRSLHITNEELSAQIKEVKKTEKQITKK